MLIKDIFVKDLFRPINGVVKADQLDEEVVWQELDEYVVTHELDKHLRKFFATFLDVLDNPNDPSASGRIGVWVSGFFGSGKSHFIKILSYLLKNSPVHNPDKTESQKPSKFFDKKINDSLLLADIKRAVQTETDVILFNIDSKATNKEGRDAILSVFIKVFNEMQGYSPDAPHLAAMERYLDERGLLQKFHIAFKKASGEEWIEERDAYLLMKDETLKALSTVLGKSAESVSDWFDKAEDSYNFSIEKFAASVKKYLNKKGPKHKIVFLADEIGQFIGSDTHLMLNLQTIIEDLGRLCNGRAWVIVTSQEDIDAVLGEIRGTKANDFSKIQGRFHTRLSLSSSNTDEVIQRRLLEKSGGAIRILEDLFEEKGDILKNQLSFRGGATLKNFKDKEDFARSYPFAPYHFQLIQKVFESIRKAGATGLHLSRGERSMLDAFQLAAKNVSESSIGILIPLYEFYPAIESFLDTAVKKTIEQAKDNLGLEKFDIRLLQILFLIRYVDIMKPNIDNLVTLCVKEVDDDRLELKRKIEDSLHRLEKETLINRSGDLYFFLTNEERDVSREIKNTDIASNEKTRLVSELIFDDVLKGETRHRYQQNRKDYTLNRICDRQPYKQVNNDLTLEVITPLHEEFEYYNSPKCIMQSNADEGRVLIKLSENSENTNLDRELQTCLQTEKYVRLKNDAAAPDNLKKILQSRSSENRERRNRLIALLDKQLTEADYFVLGQAVEQNASTPKTAIANAIDYLITNLYTKLSYLNFTHTEPQKEIRAMLMADDMGQYIQKIEGGEANEKALKEVQDYINLTTMSNQRIVLNELVKRFASRPFGWPDWDIVILVTRLFITGDIKLVKSGSLKFREAIEPLTKQVRWKEIDVVKKKTSNTEMLDDCRKLAQELFGKIGPEPEDGLFSFIKENLKKWFDELRGQKKLADTGNYPGGKEINDSLKILEIFFAIPDSYEFFNMFHQKREDLKDLSEDYHDLNDFYKNQLPTWQKLQKAMESVFSPNRNELEKDDSVKNALNRIDEILSAQSPYRMLKDAETLITTVQAHNNSIVEEKRKNALILGDKKIEGVSKFLDKVNAAPDLRNQALKPIQDLLKQIKTDQTISGIFYLISGLSEEAANAIDLIDQFQVRKEKKSVKVIRSSDFTGQNYLETEDEVEEFINNLKKEMLKAVEENLRIRIH